MSWLQIIGVALGPVLLAIVSLIQQAQAKAVGEQAVTASVAVQTATAETAIATAEAAAPTTQQSVIDLWKAGNA